MHVTLSVDALSPNLGGIGRYCWELASNLGDDSRVDHMAFSHGATWIADPADLLDEAGSARHRKKPWRKHVDRWWNHGRFDRRIFHSPNYFLPDWAEGGIATVHDLSVFRYPETHPVERVRAFEKNFSATIARAGLILTDCQWMRDEVVEFTGLTHDKVLAVPLGISADFHPRPRAALEHALAAYKLPIGEYGLCVSTLEPRKRIGHLLKAWRELPAALRNRHPLVLAGDKGWSNAALLAQIEQGEHEGWLRYLGYVPEALLPALYAGARAFAYPSLYEGFGLPPLEAMASGVPTLVSVGTCLEEVTSSGAMLIDPEDITVMRDALVTMLEPGQWRDNLSSAGVQMASQYTWAACIDQTVSAYEAVLKKGH